MAIFTVRQGKRYRATIALSWWEQVASNAMIAQQLEDAGFTEVSVTGSGTEREAEALWPAADASADVPSQVSAVTEIEV
jgi:hypothetical protein